MYFQKVLNKLNQSNMKLKGNKGIFDVNSVKFLSYMIIARGIEADPAKIIAVDIMPPPKSKKQIQKLKTMIGVLNKFISKVSDKTKPLIQLLKIRLSYKWQWTPKSFWRTDDLLINSTYVSRAYEVTHWVVSRPHKLCDQWSIVQRIEKTKKLIYYLSRTLLSTKTRYSYVKRLWLALM